MTSAVQIPGTAVDLYWLPLGAGDGTHLVRHCGRTYERLTALRQHRGPQPLFHSALKVLLNDHWYVVEMGPVWGNGHSQRGVVGEGPVGTLQLGRSPLFRYEVRRWLDGVLPDADEAVESPQRLSRDPASAARVLELVPQFPCRTWGRDELRTGDMWNSNSLVAWVLARSGHDTTTLWPPCGGRAPGWSAGLVEATRSREERRARESAYQRSASPAERSAQPLSPASDDTRLLRRRRLDQRR
jgi:hypothetical protein